MDMKLLLVDAVDRKAVLDSAVSIDQAQKGDEPDRVDHGKPKEKEVVRLIDDNASVNDLGSQRWGVIVPEVGGDELFELIQQLVAVRVAEQENNQINGDAPGRPFKVPPDMGYTESAQWVQQALNTKSDEERPRYLLILGHPAQVSLELQHALSVYYFVGRLAFDKPEGYSAYAAKAVAYSKPERWRSDVRAVSFTVLSAYGNDAPDDGYKKLMQPAVALSEKAVQQAVGRILIKDVSPAGGMATAEDFLRSAAGPSPTILMSMSHGIGRGKRTPWNDDQLRLLQGQMSFGYGNDPLSTTDVGTNSFVPGGLWFYFACFGAGTPGSSAYAHWLSQVAPTQNVLSALPENGVAFIASLPQAALANPDGPLGVIGHVDLAWSFSYDQGLSKHQGQEMRLLRLTELAKRDKVDPYHPHRIGPGFKSSFMSDLLDVQQELTSMYDDDAKANYQKLAKNIDLKQRANLWMLRQDLRAYILLGDPAAYLPVALPLPPPKATVENITGFVSTAKPAPDPVKADAGTAASRAPVSKPAPEPPKFDTDKIAQIVDRFTACIKGTATEREVSDLVGVERGSAQWNELIELYHQAGRAALASKLRKL